MENQMTTQKDKQMLYVAYICYILSIIFAGIPSLIGLIIAYVKRKDVQGTIYADHCTFLIRTFWISLILGLLSVLTMFIGIGLIVLIIGGLWFVVRVVVGLVKLHGDQAVNPTGWLF